MANNIKYIRCPKCGNVYKVLFDDDVEGIIGECSKCRIEFVNHTKLTTKRRFYDYLNGAASPRLLCSCTFHRKITTPPNYFDLTVAIATLNGLCFRFECSACRTKFEIILERFDDNPFTLPT